MDSLTLCVHPIWIALYSFILFTWLILHPTWKFLKEEGCSTLLTWYLCFLMVVHLLAVLTSWLHPPSPLTSECQCHGHADSCHFSQRAWLSSGGTSGGICNDCRHNTIGRRCQRCRHGYHRHPSLPLTSPHACTRETQSKGGSGIS